MAECNFLLLREDIFYGRGLLFFLYVLVFHGSSRVFFYMNLCLHIILFFIIRLVVFVDPLLLRDVVLPNAAG